MSRHVNTKGYVQVVTQGRAILEHRLVWEASNGPVPPGHDIHHIDGNKLNNALENLECVSRIAHKRIHGGCELRDGVWWKPCARCGERKPIGREHWYMDRSGRSPVLGRCKRCHIRAVVERKRRKRAALLAMRSAS